MSIIKVKANQIGIDTTATNNFSLEVPSTPNGTLKLARGNSGSTTTDLITVDANNNVSIPNLVASANFTPPSYYTFRNKIINGNLIINQRAVSSTSISNSYMADRWKVENGLTTPTNVTYNIFVTATTGIVSSNRVFNITANTTGTQASNEFCAAAQYIEGNNIRDLAWGTSSAKPITISFTANASSAFVATVFVRNSGNTLSYVVPVTISNAFTRYSVTIPGPTTATWATDETIGMSVGLCYASGATFKAPTNNTWSSGNYIASTTQGNILTSAGFAVNFSDFQVETGTTATPYEYRNYGTELALCQRYYYSHTQNNWTGGVTYTSNGDTRGPWNQFPVTMRTSPSVTFSPTSWSVIGTGDAASVVNVTVTYTGVNSNNNGYCIAQVGATNLAPVGGVCSWGSNTAVTVAASAEY